MKIDQVLEKVKSERKAPSRFQTRLIFVSSLDQYLILIDRLNVLCDLTINLGDPDICANADVYPDLSALQAKITANADKHIVVLSVGEFLRFRLARELDPTSAKFPSFWRAQQDSASMTRVFVPIFSGRDLFDRVMPNVDERQQDHIWAVDGNLAEGPSYQLSVFSDSLSGCVEYTVNGLREWLLNWPSKLDCYATMLSTRLYRNVENAKGTVCVSVFPNAFEYVQGQVSDGKRLEASWASETTWQDLIQRTKPGQPFSDLIKSVLNIQDFRPPEIVGRWDSWKELERTLIWIWFRLNESSSYCASAIMKAPDAKSVPNELRDHIIGTGNVEWIAERATVIKRISSIRFTEDFFRLLDTEGSPQARLRILTYGTHEEKAYAVKTICEWLRDGGTMEDAARALGKNYSELRTYLTSSIEEDAEANEYFAWYKANKIINRPVPDGRMMGNIDSYKSRFSYLDKERDADTFVLWVDGMGLEWLPLLADILNNTSTVKGKRQYIASAILPTETEYNNQWDDMSVVHSKINRLDKLAHSGMPDDKNYHSCIATQLQIIIEVAQEASDLLGKYSKVIITADHGSSRLAALAFHATAGIAAPDGAIVRSHGRYCEIKGEFTIYDLVPAVEQVSAGGKNYLVMKNYAHYAVSGNAAGGNNDDKAVVGELHGGKTPEEYLVPVIVIEGEHKKAKQPILDFSLASKVVYSERNVVSIVLNFSADVDDLEVASGEIKGQTLMISPREWQVSFVNLESKDYVLEVSANGYVMKKRAEFTVKTKGTTVIDPFGDF
jgi:hypothetical protein